MYSSEFGVTGFEREEGTWLPVNAIASGRYSFYKVRLNGMLHFVKTPSPKYKQDLLTLESLRKEFTIAYPLNHPAVVRYLRFDNSSIYEEYVDGETIRELIEADDIRLHDSDFIDRIARTLLEALDYIHSVGVTHLDIKPENLMITRLGNRLKIIDFSCAKSGSLDSTPGFTPEYMAPEQLEGETGIETDIYLAGVTIRRIVETTGDERRWRKFLRRATATDPKERFHSAAEAIKVLPPRKGKLKELIIGLALIIPIAIILFSFFYFRHQETGSTQPGKLEKDTVSLETLPQERVEGNELPENSSVVTPPIQGNNPVAPSPTSPSPTAPSVIPDVVTTPNPASDVEASLAKNIKNYVQGYYKRYVHPACRIPGYDEKGILNHDRDSKIQAAISEAIRKCNQYGDNLISGHPDKAEFITRYLRETINNEQQYLWPIMEKSAKVNQPARERIKSDPNKTEWEKDIDLSKISQ